MGLSFKEVCELKVGDEIVEMCYFERLFAKVVSAPIIKDSLNIGGRQVEFEALDKEGNPINYLLTENHMHYGPKLYRPEDFFEHNGHIFLNEM